LIFGWNFAQLDKAIDYSKIPFLPIQVDGLLVPAISMVHQANVSE